MFNILFGEGQYALKMVVAFIVVFGLLALALWVLRRFGGERLSNSGTRGRQPRLAVVDSAGVDGRRRLLLIRRDNVEHLVMIGGPTDVLIEPNIVRAAGAAREVPASRISGGETLPRPVPLNDGAMWPLQPEPAARTEPSLRPEAPARPARAIPSASEESPDRSEPNVPSLPQPALRERRMRSEALPGAPEEQPRTPLPSENERSAPPPRPVPRRETRMRPASTPAPAAASEPSASSSADQSLADVAQRLEAALRRPARDDATRAGNGKPVAAEGEVEAHMPAVQAHRPAVSEPPKPPRSEARVTRSEPKAAPGSLYDSLEQEMASLLGRPGKA